jgi:division protein CdvB (Snf7/Vps24/ESCRT-III family)
LLEEAKEIIKKWADKYNVILEQVKENVFYIKGVN